MKKGTEYETKCISNESEIKQELLKKSFIIE
jgi:hypothetical protein